MNDEELCKMFGTTLEEVEADCKKYEAGDFSDFDFSKTMDGRPEGFRAEERMESLNHLLEDVDPLPKIKREGGDLPEDDKRVLGERGV